MVFGRKKKTPETEVRAEEQSLETTEEASSVEAHSRYTAPKGRPTPSRKQQVAARRKPLVPTDRKAAKEANKQQLREQRMREQQALQTGDERYLPYRDKGPQRRYVRDFIDARINVGDYAILAVLLFFIAGLFSQQLQVLSVMVMWIIILLWVADTWLLWRKLKKRLTNKFGTIEAGTLFYTINRAMMLRRFRLPKPQVRRGEYPQ